MRHLLLLVGVVVATSACSKRQDAVAELTKAVGPVDKQQGSEAWSGASVGTEFFLGDAARTADGSAQLEIAGGAQIAMQQHTVLRFGGKSGQSRISVELGAIDLSGTGTYGLEVGDVRLSRNGSVRIEAGDGKNTVRLTLGAAQVSTLRGNTIELVLDEPVEISIGTVVATPLPDAAVAVVDAPAVEVADAAEVPPDAPEVVAGEATIEVTGKQAELLLAGETKWTPLAAGRADLPKNAKVRTGNKTTAKLLARGVLLELGGGSRAAVTDEHGFTLETGGARIAMTGEGSVALPGGSVAMTGSEKVPSESRFDAGTTGTKVSVQRGGAKLTGTNGSGLELDRGESATLLKNGTIRPLEAIPTYFDFGIAAGEGSVTIHDPRPPTAVQFQFAGKCPDGGIIELDKDPRFRTAKISGGKESANHLVKGGAWHYRLRCTTGAGEGGAVASGKLSVVADSGRRSLPPKPGVNPFVIDGRSWGFSYQSAIPDLAVTFPGAGSSFRLHLERGGKDLTFESKSSSLRVPGSALSEGVYTYSFDRDNVKQDKVNTLKIDFDQTAPQVYIEAPVNGRPFSGPEVEVKGAVLPGWTAAVEGEPVPIDGKTRRFATMIKVPPGNALAIRLSHPQRGVHYYLRRTK